MDTLPADPAPALLSPSQASATPDSPSTELLLTRTLIASALSRLEPLFDPLAPPDDAVLRANAWFLPWLRANLLFYFDNGLEPSEATALWTHPFHRLLAVHANYRIPTPFSSLDKLDEKLSLAATELINKLLVAIQASITSGLPLAPLHTFFSAAVASLRSQYPFLADRRRSVNDRPARPFSPQQPAADADPAAPPPPDAPPASTHVSFSRRRGRRAH